jgi:hypothetical protein
MYWSAAMSNIAFETVWYSEHFKRHLSHQCSRGKNLTIFGGEKELK